MICERVRMPGASLFLCGERGREHPCSSCGAPRATRQCDAPVKRGEKPGTCDRWLCDKCSAIRLDLAPTSGIQGDTYDLCPAHARAAEKSARARIFTARMGYKGNDWLDITLGGNQKRTELGGHRGIGAAFAPSPGLLQPILRQRREQAETERAWQDYVNDYTQEMRCSYRDNRSAWDTLLRWPETTLLCFCVDPARCHRTVLADILAKLGADTRGER